VICLLGVCDPFGQVSERLLPKATGIKVSESTVRRATERTGAEVRQRLHQANSEAPIGPTTRWPWHNDAEGKTCAYVTADATGIPQQAADGGPADGRMAWVLSVYNPLPEKVAWRNADLKGKPKAQARYLAGLGSLEEFGVLLRRQAAQVGMEKADRWIAISDGGSGLENFLSANFGRVEAVILDFFHASEHLNNLAKALCPKDEAAAKQLADKWCHQLKHEGGAAVLETLEHLAPPGGRWSSAARTCYQEQLGYFRNQSHRMDYPMYIRKGWQIGSGPVESACKRVVGQRLKEAGMRWAEKGSDNVCWLRALYLGTDPQWESFWETQIAA